MADPILTGFVRFTDWSVQRMHLIGIADLILALVSRQVGSSLDWPAYLAAGLTVALSIPILMRLTLGKRGLRSIEDRGLPGNRAAFWYSALSIKGYDPKLLIISFLGAVIFALDGMRQHDPAPHSLLAFAVFWSVTVTAHFTRRWPADDGY